MQASQPQSKPQSNSPRLLEGWPLLGVTSALLLALAIAILAAMPGVDGIRMLIRATARTSLLFFLLAYIAAAAWTLWPGAATRWLRANRRYLGLSFAVSHGIHALAIYALSQADPALFMVLTNPGSLISGGLAYVFIVLLAATSFDRSAAWIGPRAWRVLHTVGLHFVWLSFVFTVGKRLGQGPFYAFALSLVFAALALRVAARLKRARTQPQAKPLG